MMLKSRSFLRRIEKDFRKHFVPRCMCSQQRNYNQQLANQKRENSRFTPTSFKLQRVLIVTKLSRYEFEKLRCPHLNTCQLEEVIRSRGTDYEHLLHMHELHKNFESKIVKCFENAGCEVQVYSRDKFRSTVSKEILKKADIIVPIGGDGSFLLAAGRASPLFAETQMKTPIVGFNSDPQRSAGRLMLSSHYSSNPEEAVARIKTGDFNWMHRSRIRTTLLGNRGEIPQSTDLYRHTVIKMEQEKTVPQYCENWMKKKYQAKMNRVLPYLALNEVFIGENLSARVSHLQLIIDHGNIINKTKCSGLCVSTGTGSTSWHTSINRITEKHVQDLLKILPKQNSNNNESINIEEIVKQYNQNLLFPPDDPRLCYSVREQISVNVWPDPSHFESRRFVDSLYVKSHCIDASLVIDGSIVYPFNDGSKALLEIHPEDALLTISLD